MKITCLDGSDPKDRVLQILKSALQKLDTKSGQVIEKSMQSTIRNHFQQIYPGSNHYSPDKVYAGKVSGNSATEVIDVPGISRAYHDLDIYPRRAQKLAIPVVQQNATKNSTSNNSNMFYVKTESGTEMLATSSGGALVAMYILKDHVHQPQDRRLMPSDATLAKGIVEQLVAWLNRS